MNRAWFWPVALGVLAGVALLAVPSHHDGKGSDADPSSTSSSSATSSGPPTAPIVLPFAEGRGWTGSNVTFVVLAPLGKAAALEQINGSMAKGEAARIEWQGDHVALYSQGAFECPQPSSGQTVACDPYWAFGPWPLPTTSAAKSGPRLLRDGFNATRVTAYVFDEAGRLLASNAPDAEHGRFTLHGDYSTLPSAAWYLGANSTAPNGTTTLPGLAQPLVERVRPQLDGLPVGGVASVRSNAYVAFYGSLFVTIRVDELVLAP